MRPSCGFFQEVSIIWFGRTLALGLLHILITCCRWTDPQLDIGRWLDGKLGGGGPKLSNGQPLLNQEICNTERDEMLERYKSHTIHCKACSGALRNIRVLRKVMKAMIVALSVMLLSSFSKAASSSFGWRLGNLGLLMAFAFLTRKLFALENEFIFTGHDHWKT